MEVRRLRSAEDGSLVEIPEEPDVVDDRPLQEYRLLRDERNGAVGIAPRNGGGVLAADRGVPTGRFAEAEEELADRRLAATRWSEHTDDLPFRDVHRDAAQGQRHAVVRIVDRIEVHSERLRHATPRADLCFLVPVQFRVTSSNMPWEARRPWMAPASSTRS